MIGLLPLLLALAQVSSHPPGSDTPSYNETLADLTGSDPGDRLLAARELRRQVRANDRQLGARDELLRLEARQERSDHVTRTGPACLTVLSSPELANAVGPCTDILRLLELDGAAAP